MPLIPLHAQKAVLTKSPRQGNNETFSNGKSSVEIDAWEVWNSRIKRRVSVVSKIYNDETSAIYRTHDKLAAELEGDDAITIGGYTYSVQEVHDVKTVMNLSSVDYEISVK